MTNYKAQRFLLADLDSLGYPEFCASIWAPEEKLGNCFLAKQIAHSALGLAGEYFEFKWLKDRSLEDGSPLWKEAGDVLYYCVVHLQAVRNIKQVEHIEGPELYPMTIPLRLDSFADSPHETSEVVETAIMHITEAAKKYYYAGKTLPPYHVHQAWVGLIMTAIINTIAAEYFMQLDVNVTQDGVLKKIAKFNQEKLSGRYASGTFNAQDAIARVDTQPESQP